MPVGSGPVGSGPVGSGGVVHVNVNCTDLERSLAFYRDSLGLEALVRTAPEAPQPGAAFGLATAQWDAWMLGGGEGFGAPVIDLLRWLVPLPVPRPDGSTVGFRCLHVGAPSGEHRTVADPDGTTVEIRPGPARLIGVTIGCSDVDRSRRFYGEIVDLAGFAELVAGTGTAPAAANTIGIWRLALGTEDIDADVASLGKAGIRCLSEPAELDMGPDVGPLRFVLFPDPDGTILELIERPTRR